MAYDLRWGFVGEFVGDTPWIHLDIAGTSEQRQHMILVQKVQRVLWSVHLQHLLNEWQIPK